MMRWLLFGALIGVLIVFPSLLTLLAAVAAWLLGKPLLVAFGLGLGARPHLPRPRGWTR
ncbi:hypothetical protein [Streptomyces sp. NBC_00648]|uniref:hypothetical protein n=1 Tax=Streptomyces sp. NBC_00648 TaxID=2975797 RepID=UPI00325064F1